jgi:hypothetical protein
MNLFTKIAFILSIVLTANLYSQECDASLFITCDIENVNILINDKLVSFSNKFETKLKMGRYKIIVLENSDRWDAKTFIDSLNVKNCDDIHLDYNFLSGIHLNSDPGDAKVFSGDSLIGYTPLFIPQGINRLRLEKEGYETKSVDYTNFGLNNPVQLKFVGASDEESFVDKTLFKILAGTMIVLGAVTAYYKIEADNSFEEYEFTGDPALLDRTDKFDIISGITFAAFQLNFGAIIYCFLAD